MSYRHGTFFELHRQNPVDRVPSGNGNFFRSVPHGVGENRTSVGNRLRPTAHQLHLSDKGGYGFEWLVEGEKPAIADDNRNLLTWIWDLSRWIDSKWKLLLHDVFFLLG